VTVRKCTCGFYICMETSVSNASFLATSPCKDLKIRRRITT
jgi:hypothetical protein